MNAQSNSADATSRSFGEGSVDPRVKIGHVHLKVADTNRSLDFYCGVLGFNITMSLGADAVFLAAGDYHHHLALNTWGSRGGMAAPAGTTGLHHFALLYPTRAALATAVRCLQAASVELTDARDHGGSLAIYIRDPDDNGVELYWDRPQDEWPRNLDGSLKLVSQPLDVDALGQDGAE